MILNILGVYLQRCKLIVWVEMRSGFTVVKIHAVSHSN